ncbi:MAG TPA: type II secretion system minor pseudopilin GspK [Terricaulis sp.]|nr:type II secretion system minor pseudopilin GspK [Terricaulis sp.]
MKKSADDRGAALVTVLTMLAILSALAIVVADAAGISLRRADNLIRMEQTRWYLLGAESFAGARLSMLNQAQTRVDQSEWQGRAFDLPLDDGLMQVTLRDGDNCFNLNAMVISDDGGGRNLSAFGLVQFSRLLDAAGVQQAQGALAAALVDWLDSDVQPMPGGVEAETYSGRVYRAANALLADVSELEHVRGFAPQIIARLAPYICVRPTSAPNLINPNTLTPAQAPLLMMAIDDLSIEEARRIIRDRPIGGWESVDAFLAHPALNGLELNEAGRAQFSTRTRYVVLSARVERDRAREYGAALLELGPDGRAAAVRRVFGLRLEDRLL